MYFEHSRSGGGPVQSIEIDRNEDYAIVCFEQYGGKYIHKITFSDKTPVLRDSVLP